MSEITRFYDGSGVDQNGRYISDYFKFDNKDMEGCHDWVQWAFPIPEPSSFNPGAPLLTKDDVQAFDVLKYRNGNIRAKNLTRMYDQTRDFFDSTYQKWGSIDHNQLRISRIIRCMKLLDYEADAWSLFFWAMSIPKTTNTQTKKIWTQTIMKEGWR